MEKIIKIEETVFKTTSDWYSYEGYQITTDKQVIKLGISTGQSCCENSGYFMSEDNFQEFEGVDLINVELTDTQLKPCADFDANKMYEGAVMFVNLNTSKGLLQFVAYNEHNGYYGHDAVVLSEQLKHEETL